MSPLRVLRGLIAYDRRGFFVNLTLWGLIWTLPLATGLVARALFDTLTGRAPAGANLTTLLALLLATAAARITAHVAGVWTWATYWFVLAGWLRRNLMARILDRPGARSLTESPSEALSRFRDDVEEVLRIVEWVVDGVGVLIAGLVGAIVMFTIAPTVTAIALLPILGIIGVVAVLRQRITLYRRAAREATGRVTDFLGEILGAVQAVKLASADEQVIRRFGELNDERRDAAVRDSLLTELLGAVFRSTVNVGTGLVLLLAWRGMRADTFTVGDFALFVFYLGMVTEAITFSGDFVARLKQTAVSVQRLLALLPDDPPEALLRPAPAHVTGPVPEAPPPPQQDGDRLHTLEVRGLTYRDPQTGRGIESIDLTLRRGEFVVLTGRIGSGKSTLLRVLLGLLPHDAGEILWNGRPVADPATFFGPPRAAYVGQVPRLFSEALRDNMLLGLREAESDLPGAVWSAVMERDVEELEGGLETTVGPRGVKLSGGQVQRTAAARMFVRAPDLLVVDDLSSALDVETEALVWERLFTRPDVTCLVVSHRRTAFRRADRIVLLSGGRVEVEGTFDDLLRTSAAMRALVHAGEQVTAERDREVTWVP